MYGVLLDGHPLTCDVALLRDVHVGLHFGLLKEAKVAELFGGVRADRQSQVVTGESDLYFQVERSRLQQQLLAVLLVEHGHRYVVANESVVVLLKERGR